jgi:two-component system, OmpR family, response regulator
MRVLIVEDDPALRLGIRRALLAEGWQADAVEDGEKALTATRVQKYDAAVLDLGLPRLDGLSVLSAWRSQGEDLSVLVLTARDGLDDRVEGLNRGADDYLGKPFEPEELVARLRAVSRRRMGQTTPVLRLGRLSYTPSSRELRCDGAEVPLSAREAALIELLMVSPDKAVTKSRIIASMSSWETEFSPNSVEIYVMRLRRKLAGSGVKIQTVRGVGYRMCLDGADGAGADT